MRGMRNLGRDKRGGVFLELLIVVLFISGLFAASAPFLLHAWREMVLEREAEILLGDIRYLRALSRNADGRPAIGFGEHERLPRTYYLYLRGKYYYLQYGSLVDGKRILIHHCASGVSVDSTGQTSRIAFETSGASTPMTIRLSYADGQKEARYVVITMDGRCRVRGADGDGS